MKTSVDDADKTSLKKEIVDDNHEGNNGTVLL